MHELPFLGFEGGHDRQYTLTECTLGYDLLQFLFRMLAVNDAGYNGGNRIVICRVKLAEYHSLTSTLTSYIQYIASKSFLNWFSTLRLEKFIFTIRQIKVLIQGIISLES